MASHFRSAALLLAFIACNFCEGGKNPRLGIIGGEETDISKFPYQVAYLVSEKLKCGGSIISSTCVLTAAHCLHNYPTNISLRVGSTQKESGGTVYNVKETQIHPKFNSVKLNNDIALLIIDGEIMFDANVKPIQLLRENQKIPKNAVCTVSGWGKADNNTKPEKLRSVVVKMINADVCIKSYDTPKIKFKVTEAMICAGHMEGGKDACTGDSGGPLMCEIDGKKVQPGVVSSGYGCALEGYPGIYANVVKFRPWIEGFCKLPAS